MKKALLILSVLFLAVFTVLFSSANQPVQTVSAQAADTCPGDKDVWNNDWYKIEGSGPFELTAPSGYIIDQVCVKGGNTNNENGYFFTTNSNGVGHTCDYYQGGGNPPTDHHLGTISVFGIGSDEAGATRETQEGSGCAVISHASFHRTLSNGEETPTPTPTDTEEDPTPTNTPTPTPTQTPNVGGDGDGKSDGRSDGRSDGLSDGRGGAAVLGATTAAKRGEVLGASTMAATGSFPTTLASMEQVFGAALVVLGAGLHGKKKFFKKSK